jgi:hypothetical protein
MLDGRQVCTWSEEWRHECEIRHALSLPDKARKPRITKLDYLNGIEDSRGVQERQKIREAMLKRWKR